MDLSGPVFFSFRSAFQGTSRAESGSGVNVLSDQSVMSLDSMVDSANGNCGDIGNEEPMLNYLRDLVISNTKLDWSWPPH